MYEKTTQEKYKAWINFDVYHLITQVCRKKLANRTQSPKFYQGCSYFALQAVFLNCPRIRGATQPTVSIDHSFLCSHLLVPTSRCKALRRRRHLPRLPPRRHGGVPWRSIRAQLCFTSLLVRKAKLPLMGYSSAP